MKDRARLSTTLCRQWRVGGGQQKRYWVTRHFLRELIAAWTFSDIRNLSFLILLPPVVLTCFLLLSFLPQSLPPCLLAPQPVCYPPFFLLKVLFVSLKTIYKLTAVVRFWICSPVLATHTIKLNYFCFPDHILELSDLHRTVAKIFMNRKCQWSPWTSVLLMGMHFQIYLTVTC